MTFFKVFTFHRQYISKLQYCLGPVKARVFKVVNLEKSILLTSFIMSNIIAMLDIMLPRGGT